MTLSLLADIGGTNTRVALANGRIVLQPSIRRFSNAAYKAKGQDIGDILRDYLASCGEAVSGLCVAAAGPVQNGVATMTNLAWSMDAPMLSAATGATKIEILNDLQAQGHALGHIADGHLRRVVDGPQTSGTMLVVGLGTGVNAAPVHGSGAGRLVPASECGHVNMPVRTAEDLALAQFITDLLHSRAENGHPGVEEVLSGRGLANLYAFAAAQAGSDSRLASAEVLAAVAAEDAIATQAAQLYTRILGQFLADLALVHLPFGGIYLIGGMSRAMMPSFARFGLSQHFREDRRIDLLTRDFSVQVVEDDYAALTGCAAWLAAQG
ncbi:ROK family protein [Xinfangfangia sp. CPCC 101601]|uniref:ROK family protein n=1 Tax=Pseudogemmobacter lacusdianii TaxID=3069608 RepID=A0ABU0VUY8_9RHOB|nr:ROK family protein [Xinfangfangia sp. CPCC 101601]MDQ2065559.1 ROK family protein [Xinfangfangia sp. CPCC 101601]